MSESVSGSDSSTGKDNSSAFEGDDEEEVKDSSVKKIPQIEDFSFIKPISRGAFGKVFLGCKKENPEKLYAIKVMKRDYMINKNLIRQVMMERNALAVSRSPFIVQLYYSLQSNKNIFLVMEYMIGGDMKNLLSVCGYFDEHMAIVYVAEVTLALEFLHSLGIIHRDLKPDNMLISNEGHIKLTDFGLCEVTINTTKMNQEVFHCSNSQEWLEKCHLTPGQILSLTSSLGFSAQKSKMKSSMQEGNDEVSIISSPVNDCGFHKDCSITAAAQKFHEVLPVCRLKDIISPHNCPAKQASPPNSSQSGNIFSDSRQEEFSDSVFLSTCSSFDETASPVQVNNTKSSDFNPASELKQDHNSNKALSDSFVSSQSETNVSLPDRKCCNPSSLPVNSVLHNTECSQGNILQSIPLSRKRKSFHRDTSPELISDHCRAPENGLEIDSVPLKTLQNKVRFSHLNSTPVSARSTSASDSSRNNLKKINSKMRQSKKSNTFRSRLRKAFEHIQNNEGSIQGKTNLTQQMDCFSPFSESSRVKRPKCVKSLESDVGEESHISVNKTRETHSDVELGLQKRLQFNESPLIFHHHSWASLGATSQNSILTDTSRNLDDSNTSNSFKTCESKTFFSNSNTGDSCTSSTRNWHKLEALVTPLTSKNHVQRLSVRTPHDVETHGETTPLRTPKSVRRYRSQPRKHRVLGTPDYLAPEILMQQKHDEAVDWWALGVCMFEFLTGVPPFNDSTPESVFQNILNRDIPWPEGDEVLSEEACAAIQSLLTMNPDKRPRAIGVKNMKIFENVAWEKLLEQPAPFQPQPSDETDTTYFEVRNNLQNLVVSSVDL